MFPEKLYFKIVHFGILINVLSWNIYFRLLRKNKTNWKSTIIWWNNWRYIIWRSRRTRLLVTLNFNSTLEIFGPIVSHINQGRTNKHSATSHDFRAWRCRLKFSILWPIFNWLIIMKCIPSTYLVHHFQTDQSSYLILYFNFEP